MTVGDFTVRLDALKVTDDGRKQMVTGTMTVLRDGAELTKMYPARWFFRKHEDEPTTEVAIRRSFAEDLYVVMPRYDVAQQSAERRDRRQSAGQLGVVRLRRPGARHAASRCCRRRAFAFAVARVPANAATTTLLLLALLAPGVGARRSTCVLAAERAD